MRDREDETEQMFGENSGEKVELQAQAESGVMGDFQAQTESDRQAQATSEEQLQAISEEQARALLTQEKMETEQRLKGAGNQKKVLAIIIGAAVFLIATGVAVWAITELRRGN